MIFLADDVVLHLNLMNTSYTLLLLFLAPCSVYYITDKSGNMTWKTNEKIINAAGGSKVHNIRRFEMLWGD